MAQFAGTLCDLAHSRSGWCAEARTGRKFDSLSLRTRRGSSVHKFKPAGEDGRTLRRVASRTVIVRTKRTTFPRVSPFLARDNDHRGARTDEKPDRLPCIR